MRSQIVANYLRPPAEDRARRGRECPALLIQEAADRRGEELRVGLRPLGRKAGPVCRATPATGVAVAGGPGGPGARTRLRAGWILRIARAGRCGGIATSR